LKTQVRSNKELLIIGIANGLMFAIIMAVFDLFSKDPFSLSKFIYNFLFFGFFMPLVFRRKKIEQ
jgi:hypothetical protein